MTVVTTLNAEPLWLQALQQHVLPIIASLDELAHAPASVMVSTPVSVAQLSELVAQHPKIILAYTAPEQAIASYLLAGQTLAAAAEQWQQQVNALLQLQRKWRRNIVLVNLGQLSYCQQNELAVLANAGWALKSPLAAQPAHFFEVLAAQLFQQQPELNALYQLLSASSLLLTEQQRAIPLNTILLHYQTMASEHKQLTQQLKHAQQQAAAAEQLHGQAHVELTLSNENLALCKQQLAELMAHQQSAQQAHKHVQSTLQSENTLLLEQLLQVQAEVEQQHHNCQHLEQQLQVQQQQSVQIEQEYNAMRTSLHNLQQVHDMQNDVIAKQQQTQASLQQQLQQSETENALLLTQLMQVQEELEKYYANAKQIALTLEQQTEQQHLHLQEQQRAQAQQQHIIDKQTGSIAQLQQQNEKHVKEAQQLKTENELVLFQLQHVQEELERYYLNNVQAENASGSLQAALSDKEKQLTQLGHEKQQLTQKLQDKQLQLMQALNDKQQQHSQHIHQQKQQQREWLKLEQQFKLQRAELASARHLLQQAEAQVAAIRTSASWKVAAPVRLIGRAIKKTDKQKQKLQQEAGLLFTSEFFDADWYLHTYPDVKDANMNPAEHYLKFGAAEGRLPGPFFDGNWYLQRYPDVAALGVNPLLHYIKFGQAEGRTASLKLLEDHTKGAN